MEGEKRDKESISPWKDTALSYKESSIQGGKRAESASTGGVGERSHY